ncbi:signal peptidase I [Caniella muris]|uniref:signal peptidase I n=1 Tax=Caniella muris TaxID=2941502 RepID=UPI00203F91F0|nr:signal peptidase I [Caniella muris]
MGRVRSTVVNVQLAVLALTAAAALGGEALGLSALAVATGSMEPSVPVGALAVCAPLGGDVPQVGDVVAYRRSGTTVLHRVVSVSGDGASLTCRGDRNEGPDPGAVPVDAVAGRLVLCVPGAGTALTALAEHRAAAVGALVAVDAAICLLPTRSRDGRGRGGNRRKRPVVG